jgi:nitrate reductase delta subunit
MTAVDGPSWDAMAGPLDDGVRRQCFKLLSLLLQYPDDDPRLVHSDLDRVIARLTVSAVRAPLGRFLAYWRQVGLSSAQQEYVRTFDFHKRVSLHLSFYQYGDRRQRGPALVRLKRLYAAAGLPLQPGELPDYLPVLLEFAAFAPPEYAEVLLGEHRAPIEMLRLALRAESPYAAVLEAACALLPPLSPADRQTIQRLLALGPPGEQVGLEPFTPGVLPPADAPRRSCQPG